MITQADRPLTAIIMAGGHGLRMRASGSALPKPLTPLAGRSLLEHQARLLAHHGYSQLHIATGPRGPEIAAATAAIEASLPGTRLDCVDTGLDRGNAGRLRELRPLLAQETWLVSWCDVISDVDFTAMRAFHRKHGRWVTLLAVREPERYGYLALDGERVTAFREKQLADRRWIHGGCFMLEPAALDDIESDAESWESQTLPRLLADDQVRAYRHEGYWSAIDTLADRDLVAHDIEHGHCPWQKP